MENYFDNTFQDTASMMGMALPDPPLLLNRDVIPGPGDRQLDRGNRHRDFFALCIVQCGRGTHVIEGVPYAIARGDVYVMGLNTTHFFTKCQNLIIRNFFFSPEIFDGATRDTLAEVPGFSSLIPGLFGETERTSRAGRWLHLPPDAYERLEDQMAELGAEWESHGMPGRSVLLRCLFTRLLISLARFQAVVHPRLTHLRATVHSTAINEAIRILEEGYAEPLHIAQVAEAVFLSPDRFTKVFTQAVGQTPREYLRHIRIERAKALLEATHLSLAVVAGQSGLGAQAYFTHAFRAATGQTPGEYRRSRTMA